MILYPLIFKPIYKDYIWGGKRILHHFLRDEPSGIYAESWELSDRSEGMSIITNGPLQGKPLQQLLLENKEDLLGKDTPYDQFPLLIKLIDANRNLSIQVHPDDNSAKKHGGEAKTEAWYVIAAEKDATIYSGFKKPWEKEDITEKLPTKDILSLMHTIPVKAEDVIFIPGGRLHAIGAGCLILEIQQNSDTTYRVYDWGRNRPLHLKEANNVIRFNDTDNPLITSSFLEENSSYQRKKLLKSPYFTLEKWKLNHSIDWDQTQDRFEILFFLEGQGNLLSSLDVPITKGTTCLLPAHGEKVTIQPQDSPLTFLRIIPQAFEGNG